MHEITAIRDVASIKHGYAFEGQFFTNEKQEHILLTPGNFHVDQKLYFGVNTKYYIGPVPSDYILTNGDLLVVMTDLTKDMAILGNAVILKSELPVLHNQRIGLIETLDSVSKSYFCYLLNSEYVRKHVKATASGTTVRHTSPSKILDIKAFFPPLPEQKKIAQILSTWDNAISATERLLANSQQRKKALMQQLLTGKKRLPGFEGEWTVNSIEKVFAITRGAVQETVEKGKYDLIVMGSISERGRLIIKNRTNSNLTPLSVNDLVMPERDIGNGLIIGRTVIIEKNDQYVLGPNVLRLRLKNNQSHSAMFWNFLFNTYHVRKEVKKITSGTSQLMITGKDVKRLSVYIPVNPSEQQAIANVLTTADQEIDALHKRIGHLKQEKKALMQQLLTGKRRVQVEDAA